MNANIWKPTHVLANNIIQLFNPKFKAFIYSKDIKFLHSYSKGEKLKF